MKIPPPQLGTKSNQPFPLNYTDTDRMKKYLESLSVIIDQAKTREKRDKIALEMMTVHNWLKELI